MVRVLILTLGATGCSIFINDDKQDYDGDGFIGLEDCDDGNWAVSPNAPEVCDGIDNDCDGQVDDADPDVDLSTERIWYADTDGDGFGDPDNGIAGCMPPPETVTNDDDCDDTDGGVHPDAGEICNEVDDNCNGLIDDEDHHLDTSTGSTFYQDRDEDGFGDASRTVAACVLPAGSVDNAEDCDDLDPAVHPDANEVCNGIDDDCNSETDDADSGLDLSTAQRFYADSDSDGYGDPNLSELRCEPRIRYVDNSDDCNPALRSVHPGAREICNNIDDDCDNAIDDADDSVDLSTGTQWYVDDDGDAYGDDRLVALACDQPFGFAAAGGDCDDETDWINPGAPDRCNYVDDDCDETTDHSGVWWYDPVTESWTDYTSNFQAGTAAAPAAITAPGIGGFYVCAGTYRASIEAVDDLAVLGPDGPDATVLDGGYDVSGVGNYLVEGVALGSNVVTGVTLRNAYGGIYADGGEILAWDTVLEDHAGAFGDAVTGFGTTVELEDVQIRRNAGYAAFYLSFGTASLTDVTFEDNTSGRVASFLTADATLAGVTSRDNDTSIPMYFSNGDVDLSDIVAANNTVSGHGGALYFTGSSGTVADLVASTNTAGSGLYGGAVYASTSDLTYTDCTLTGNTAFLGGGLYETSGTSTLTNCRFTGNHATGTGGGMRAFVHTATVTDSSFSRNTATVNGAGAGLNEATVDFGNTSFVDNTADAGAAECARTAPTS